VHREYASNPEDGAGLLRRGEFEYTDDEEVVSTTSLVPELIVPSAVSRMFSADCFRLYRRLNLAAAVRSGSARIGSLCVLTARANTFVWSRLVNPYLEYSRHGAILHYCVSKEVTSGKTVARIGLAYPYRYCCDRRATVVGTLIMSCLIQV
jgi:hypothetical protein